MPTLDAVSIFDHVGEVSELDVHRFVLTQWVSFLLLGQEFLVLFS